MNAEASMARRQQGKSEWCHFALPYWFIVENLGISDAVCHGNCISNSQFLTENQ